VDGDDGGGGKLAKKEENALRRALRRLHVYATARCALWTALSRSARSAAAAVAATPLLCMLPALALPLRLLHCTAAARMRCTKHCCCATTPHCRLPALAACRHSLPCTASATQLCCTGMLRCA